MKERWIRRLRERLQDERGVAIITAMLLSMVVVTLGATSVSLAVHSSESSAYDRRKIQSIHAAEAGVNYFFSHLQSGGSADFKCQASLSLTTTPPARFDATAAYYDASGNPLPCPLGGIEPDSALIRSVGRTATAPPARTMEALVKLVPVPGGPFGEFAIFSEASPQFNSNVQVFGGEAVEGNVYSNGSVLVNSNTTIYGDIEAQGSVTLSSNATVKRDILAGSEILLNSNATVFQDATSSESSITLNSNAHVFGDATAATTVTLSGNSSVDGLVVPGSPSPAPSYRPFPELVFDALAWQEAGYSVQSFASCDDAKAYLGAISSGSHVVRINAACDLSYASNEELVVRGNLAIVSDGSLTMSSNSRFANAGGESNLFLLFGLGRAAPCNITFNSNSGIGAGLKTVLYSYCNIDMRSNTLVMEGQMFGGSVRFNSNASLTYKPIGVPGFGASTYDENILYIREVTSQ